MSKLNIDWGLSFRRSYVWRESVNDVPGDPIIIPGAMGLRITFLDEAGGCLQRTLRARDSEVTALNGNRISGYSRHGGDKG